MNAQPLAGLRIVNTRASRQASSLTRLLEAEGAEVLHYPTVEIKPCADSGKLDAALKELAAGRFDWLVITSANTVYTLADRLRTLGIQHARIAQHSTMVAAVGSATASAVREELNLSVDLLPDAYVAESLAASLRVGRGSRVLLPQSALARPLLVNTLRRVGAEVAAVTAYRTVVGHGGDDLPRHFRQGNVDAVVFTSASTVHNFVERLKAEIPEESQEERGEGEIPAGRERVSNCSLLSSYFSQLNLAVACIGPKTAEAARGHELPVQVVADDRTVEGLVHSLKAFFAGHPR